MLHTGDMFRIDADGYMYFQSRTDDVIKSRGQKVSPREIENVLHGVPGVCEAGRRRAGRDRGNCIKAVSATWTTDVHAVTEHDILQHCAQHLEDFMVPRSVEIVDTLPHTPTGKLSRRALLDSAIK